ncbi:NADP-dependent oxidoreductase [Frankia sp. CNm7]|uniref:NADP-dependent oxidoreductase n=1 Tax=Frankia nepalensis TaxID=1836974 RepID=A0A937R7B4_9ACTN|nr:NADP-dependent oxidoreductase [Frankia nepalensis]MBL7500837.1 NADP-dependent oxidoreductase [Frankia nepalensis]MBL7515318.1 NADP-dependent oxidoreductase [Frankia nepalensis]MBL7522269.1 NADP-dependent oxidoreductase [Frankia nepalensis]MBL7627033.1 NADP-dependent oxidoreductase [Frankia nepalensis]
MRALNVPAAGEQPRLSDLPVPAPVEDTVLVRVKAAGLNALDNALAAGMMAEMLPHVYPLVLGRDAAGVVEAVGAGVDHVAIGDEVIGHMLLVPPIQAGTLAEYALLPAAAVTRKPTGLDFTAAAALPLAAAAAKAAVDAIEPRPGQTVLVVGAGGGVGSYTVQLLAARGVTVVATATAVDTDRLTTLGATTVIDYTAGPVAQQVATVYPDGVDALIDLVAYTPDTAPLELVRKGGKVASTLGAADEQALAALGLTGTSVMATPVREVIAELAEQVTAGTLKVDITTVLPLENATDGLATLASGTARGKIVIEIGD